MKVRPFWWFNSNKRKKSGKQEKELAIYFKGEPVLNSGAGKWEKGDVKFSNSNLSFLIECKRTDKLSYSLKKDVWTKIEKESLKVMKLPLMEIDIQDLSLIVMRKKDFKELVDND